MSVGGWPPPMWNFGLIFYLSAHENQVKCKGHKNATYNLSRVFTSLGKACGLRVSVQIIQVQDLVHLFDQEFLEFKT